LIVTENRFILPSFSGADLYHYVSRARSVWNCEDFSRLISKQYLGADGLLNQTERVFFGLNCVLDLNDAYFSYYVVLLAILSNFLAQLTFYFLFLRMVNSRKLSTILLILLNILNNFTEGFNFQIPTHFDTERWPTPPLHYAVVNTIMLVCLMKKQSITTAFGLSLTLIASVNLYFYTWQISFIILLIFIAVNSIQKNYKFLRWGLFSLLFSLLLSIDYFKSLFGLREKTGSESRFFFEDQAGFQQTHNPRLSLYIIFALVMMLIAGFSRMYSTEVRVFSVAVGAGSIVAYNQNLVTGILIQEGHYFWYFIKPYSIMLFFIMISSFTYYLNRARPLRRLTLVVGYFLCGLVALQSVGNTSPKEERLTMLELEALPTNIFSFDEMTQYYLSYNTDGDFAPIGNMIYYPNSLPFVREHCRIQLLWNYPYEKGSSFESSIESLSVCRALFDSKMERAADLQGEIERLSSTPYLSDWINSQGIKTLVLTVPASESQKQILTAAGLTKVVSKTGVWSKM